MDKTEALRILHREVERLRQLSYLELRPLVDETYSVTRVGESGKSCQIKVHAVWDNAPEGNLRVFCELSEDAWTSFFPLCEDFILAPDGSFLGE